MKTVWTQEADARLRDYLASHELVAGIGTEKSTCSVAAINLALTEKVMDTIPKCMSKVIGQWMMAVQDVMPWEMRNSPGWKCLLPMAAGTGREREEERLALVMDWMWGTVLPDLQSVADQGGFGAGWRIMCTERSLAAAARRGRWCLSCRMVSLISGKSRIQSRRSHGHSHSHGCRLARRIYRASCRSLGGRRRR